MQEGVIVYLVKGGAVPEGANLAAACRNLGLAAHQVALVGLPDGFFAVEEAWHHLYTRGCGRINLLVAQWETTGLEPLHPPVRLCG